MEKLKFQEIVEQTEYGLIIHEKEIIDKINEIIDFINKIKE